MVGNLYRYMLVFLLGLIPAPGHSVVWDSDREALIAYRLSEELQSGELVWLKSPGGQSVAAVFTSAGPYLRPTAVILLHGMGAHPDWPVIISPLRKHLAKEHWSSLSIQLPVLANDQPVADYGRTLKESSRRIRMGVEYLIKRNYRDIVLIGYGFGAMSALEYIVNRDRQHIAAFAGISMLARKFLEPRVDMLAYLERAELPILDIYGSDDMNFVVKTADDRRLYASKTTTKYITQRMVEGADHYYTGHEQTVFGLITKWLGALQQDPEEENLPQQEK